MVPTPPWQLTHPLSSLSSPHLALALAQTDRGVPFEKAKALVEQALKDSVADEEGNPVDSFTGFWRQRNAEGVVVRVVAAFAQGIKLASGGSRKRQRKLRPTSFRILRPCTGFGADTPYEDLGDKYRRLEMTRIGALAPLPRRAPPRVCCLLSLRCLAAPCLHPATNLSLPAQTSPCH